jgi:hypothetical protein
MSSSSPGKKIPRLDMNDFVPKEILTHIFSFLAPIFIVYNVRLVCSLWRKAGAEALRKFMKDNVRLLCAMKSFFENSEPKQTKLLSHGFLITISVCLRRELPKYSDYPDIFPSRGLSGDDEADIRHFWRETINTLQIQNPFQTYNTFPSIFISILEVCRCFSRITLNELWHRELNRQTTSWSLVQTNLAKFREDKHKLLQEQKQKTRIVGIFQKDTLIFQVTFPITSLNLVTKKSRFLWIPSDDADLFCRMNGLSCLLNANGSARIFASGPDQCENFCHNFLEDLQKGNVSDKEEKCRIILKKILEVQESYLQDNIFTFGLPHTGNEADLNGIYGENVFQKNLSLLPRNSNYYIEAFKHPEPWSSKKVWSLILYDVLRILDIWPRLTDEQFSMKALSRYREFFSLERFVSLVPNMVSVEKLHPRWTPFVDPWIRPLQEEPELILDEQEYSPPRFKKMFVTYIPKIEESEKLTEAGITPHSPIKFKKSNIFCLVSPNILCFYKIRTLDECEDLLTTIKKKFSF